MSLPACPASPTSFPCQAMTGETYTLDGDVTYTIVMPQSYLGANDVVYVFNGWSDGVQTATRTVYLNQDTILSANYAEQSQVVPPVITAISLVPNPAGVGQNVVHTATVVSEEAYTIRWYVEDTTGKWQMGTTNPWTHAYPDTNMRTITAIATNSAGDSPESAPVVLTFSATPTITSISVAPPPPHYENDPITLTAVVSGDAPITVRWYDSVDNLLGTGNPFITSFANEGTYVLHAIATNPIGNSPPFGVTLNIEPLVGAVVLTIGSAENGTTDPPAGEHSVAVGTTIPVTAIPNSNYKLSEWLLDGVSAGSSPTINVPMFDNHTLVPVFTTAPIPIVPIVAGSALLAVGVYYALGG